MLTLPDYPVRQRDFLLEISRAITARLETEEVLRRVLRASVVMLAGKVGVIALRADDGLFYVRAFTGIKQDQISDLNTRLQDLLSGASDTQQYHEYLDSRLREMAESIDDTLRQSVAMPLKFADEPLGLLIVFRSYQAQITSNDLQILQSFANQAAIAVHNAQLYETVQQERQRLAALLQYSGDGVMILDEELNILQINRAFERMTGWTSDAAVGLNQDDVLTWERLEKNELRDAIEQGWDYPSTNRTRTTFYVEGDLIRRDGMTVSLGITYAPLFDGQQHMVNIIASIRDITSFRRAQEMQNVFISTISHELRTPVALIKGYASTLSREDATWDEQVIRQSLQVIEEEADRLTDLIEDLLTASKIQAEHTVALQLADVHLDKLGENALQRFKTQSTRHRFELSFPENFPVVQGDPRRLRQVIDNLLTNAIKYSPDGGTITIGGRFTRQNVTLFVRDEGAGIPEQELPHIFDRFYRVDGNLTSRTKGTGLGLYLVKAIIEAHQGEIHVKSTPGQGSTFYFNIPID